MYAFIKLGGHQHRVEPDMVLLSEKTGHEVGSDFICSDVLFVDNDSKIQTSPSSLKDATVKLRVLADTRAPKIDGFKYKKRKNYRRRWGHRQDLQKLQVLSIEA